MTKHDSTRDKWGSCHKCGITLISCKGLTRDRGHGCCTECAHEEAPRNEEV